MRHPRRGPGPAIAAACALTALAVLMAGCAGGGTKPPGGGTTAGPGAASPSATAAAAGPAARLLARALAAAKAAGTAHIVARAKTGPSVAVYVQDCAAADGRQVITANGGGEATVLDIGGVGYIKGNTAALSGFLAFPGTLAERTAGRWISFHSGDDGYQHVVAGVTLSSVLGQISLLGVTGPAAPRTVAGHRVIALRGEVPPGWGIPTGVQGTLYVSATGPPLPVSFHASAGGGAGGEDITFSKWGERVRLAAPAASDPIRSVQPDSN